MKNLLITLIFLSFGVCKPSQNIEKLNDNVYENFSISEKIIAKNDKIYKIFIAKSKTCQTQCDFLYILDANAHFPMILNLVKKPDNLIIIGIGYKTDQAYDIKNRTKDYTPKIQNNKDGGGDKEFLSFLKDEVFKMTENGYKIKNRAIFGHSFGGLFVLNTLLVDSSLFTHYFIASPSLWWGESSFLPSVLSLKTCPKIFITLGSLEKQRSEFKHNNAKNLAKRLKNDSKCDVVFKLFENKTHGSVIKKSLNFTLENFK